MKQDWSLLEPHRLRKGYYGSDTGNSFGFFVFQRGGRQVRAIACDGTETGWEHVSVSVIYKNEAGKITHPMPTWGEMCSIKDMFWEKEECVVQFHPAESEYVNLKENCLHMWKCVSQEFPMPPKICV